MLIFLTIGTAYSEQLPNKPFKVCPEKPTQKDYPCVTFGPTATIVQRQQVKTDEKEIELKRLQEENALLRKLLDEKNK